jgi:hypothetical protein
MVETHPENGSWGTPASAPLDSQLEQLRAAGCSSRNIYREKVTGARADRRELLRMLRRLAPGDVVMVTRIDRLARSTFEPLRHRQAHRRREAEFRSLAEPLGRHRHQHRAFDAGGTRRPRRRRARSHPHPHRRRPKPRQGARKAHGPPPFPDTGTAERGHQTARAGRYARRTRPQLYVGRATISRLMGVTI